MRIDVLGVAFDDLSMEEAVQKARSLIKERRAAFAVTPNPEIVMLCRENEAARRAVAAADMVLADGVGVVYGAKLLGKPLKTEAAGHRFRVPAHGIPGAGGRLRVSAGGQAGIAELAAASLREKYPGLVIAGPTTAIFRTTDPLWRASIGSDRSALCLPWRPETGTVDAPARGEGCGRGL
jgi:N-acetylglucosaminyldiphosphoundecaprenol N-acetyl-beta-D-mannosaminyltransferase